MVEFELIADIPAYNFISGAEDKFAAIRIIDNGTSQQTIDEIWVVFTESFGRSEALSVRAELKSNSSSTRVRVRSAAKSVVSQLIPQNGQVSSLEVDDSEVNRDFETLLEQAITMGASDFHIYVRESTGTAIKYRVSGRLKSISTRSYDHGIRMLAMIMGFLSEQNEDQTFQKNKRQSATVEKVINDKAYRLRSETFPIEGGLKFVARIACMDSSGQATIEFEDAGFLPDQIMRIRAAMMIPSGAIIIAGVTGSGKTTTIQAIMSGILESGDVEAITIENPVELLIRNATQISVTKHLPFKDALAAAMRADPDVLMVAEIRDTFSAETAVAASITGHNFVSTIHAASPMGINVRLDGFGVPRHVMGSPDFYKLLMHQKLVQHVCPKCGLPFMDKSKEVYDMGVRLSKGEASWRASIARWNCILDEKPQLAAHADKIVMRNPNGCEHCDQGFSGRRSVIAEVINVDNTILDHISKKEDSKATKAWLESGGISKYEHAIEKVLAGQVCPFSAENGVGAITHDLIMNDDKILRNEVKNLGGYVNDAQDSSEQELGTTDEY